jgi:excisionase family DNA binding protein
MYSRIEKLYTASEIAELLCVHPRTVKRNLARNQYDFVRLGQRVRVKASIVADILEYGWEHVDARARSLANRAQDGGDPS